MGIALLVSPKRQCNVTRMVKNAHEKFLGRIYIFNPHIQFKVSASYPFGLGISQDGYWEFFSGQIEIQEACLDFITLEGVEVKGMEPPGKLLPRGQFRKDFATWHSQ